MCEVRCKTPGNGAWAAAHVEEGIEIPAGGGVVICDGLVEARVLAAVAVSVVCALPVGVGAECLFHHDL